MEIGESIRLYNWTTSGWSGTGENGVIGSILQCVDILPTRDVMGNYAPLSRLIGFDVNTSGIGDMYRATDATSKSIGMNGNVYAKIDFLKNFSFKTSLGYVILQTDGRTPLDANPDSYQARSENQLTMSTSKTFQWNWINTLDYTTTFAKIHTVNVTLGTEAIDRVTEDFSAMRTGYLLTTQDYYILNAGSGSQTNSGSDSEWALFSWFGRVHYAFDNKYLLDLTLRRDGSSRFGKNYRYAYFPAVGLGWRLSEEKFMDASKSWLSSLKLRASYGQSGNDAIGNYNGFTTMGTSVNLSNYNITNGQQPSTGFQSTAFGNPDARWEKTISTTIGVDATFLNSFNFMFDYWQRNTQDMLYRVPIAAVVGDATAPSVNIGEMKNVGVDIQVGYQGTALKNDLSYWATLNFSHYRNEIVKLSNSETETILGSVYRDNRYVQSEVGTTFPAYYGYKVLGIFQSDEEAAAYPQASFISNYNKAGRFKFEDVNGDGVINSEDRTYIGNPHPDFISSLNLGVRYKQFDLNASFYASVGNDLINVARRGLDFYLYEWNRSKRRLYESWGSPYLKDNRDAKMPMAEVGDVYNQNPNSYFVEDGSYLRFENLTVGYSLPPRWINRIGLQDVRLYVMGSNLFTITKYSGLDPMISSSDSELGVDNGIWPTPRRYFIGIDITF